MSVERQLETEVFGVAASDAEVAASVGVELDDPAYFFNRELSWLKFNQRVLELAMDPNEALLERLKFSAIFSTNLDEFFMIRVAGLHDQIDAGIETRGPDGRTPIEAIDTVRAEVLRMCGELADCVTHELLPSLASEGIKIVDIDQLSKRDRQTVAEQFATQIFPVLTPLAVGLGRPFPYISNLSLSLAVLLREPNSDQTTFARVKVPKEMLPRFVPVGSTGLLVPLEQVIADNLQLLFPGTEIISCAPFRVTRDADFTVSDEADDLVKAVEQELRRRRFGEVVRLDIGVGMDPEVRRELVEALEIEERDVYETSGLFDLKDLWQIVGMPGHSELRDEPWTTVTHPRLSDSEGEPLPVMAAMRQGDILVHHPYDSFSASVERFVAEAVADPDVLAIKQTVYRTSDDSPLVPALILASERGKQAVCLVE
ncbi:MAG: polyphosphate kinase, partial [Thermoleophilaceae bacterium]|nr:polyphosphate kinase [Thermoleophilaceae bacterium]